VWWVLLVWGEVVRMGGRGGGGEGGGGGGGGGGSSANYRGPTALHVFFCTSV